MRQSGRGKSYGWCRVSPRGLLCGALMVLTLGGVPAIPKVAEAARPIVAVFDITVQGRARIKKQLLRSLADYLATQLTAAGVYQVVPRDQLATRLRQQKRSSYKKCFQQTCQIAIGKELAASKSLATKIMKIGKLCVLSATLYDLRTAASERAATQKGRCDEESLLKSIDLVANKLSGGGGVVQAGQQPGAQGDVKLSAMATVAGVQVRWPPRCPNPKGCLQLARKMKEQDQGLVLALSSYVRAKKTAQWAVATKARVFARELTQGYVPRQTQLEGTLKRSCQQRRQGACYAMATLRAVEGNKGQQRAFLAKACDQNELAACTTLGTLLRQGKGVAKNESKALSLYRRACNRRYLPACSQLAYMYRYGRGVTKNETKALSLYRRACGRRYWQACQSLGFYFSYGKTKNYSRALAIYRRACDGGYPQSCTSLAYMYKMGRGVAANPAKARAIYMKACRDGYVYGCTAAGDYTRAAQLRQRKCDSGDLYACNSLAYMYKKGRGVAMNISKANAIYRRSCNMGNVSACISINDNARVAALYRRGCDGGNTYSCNSLANKYRYGRGVPINKYKAVALYRKACDGGYAHGCNNLAYMYKYGYGVSRNTAMARSIYQRACKMGNRQACRNATSSASLIERYRRGCNSGNMTDCSYLAARYRFGTGVTKNYFSAMTYYRKACNGGHMRSCYEIGYLYKYGFGVRRNASTAGFYYRKACAGGYRLACRYARGGSTGGGFSRGPVAASYSRARSGVASANLSRYRRGCNRGVRMDCYNLGSAYRYGRHGAPKNRSMALTYLRKACTQGHMMSCYQAGFMYKTGEGIPKNRSQAIYFYDKACRGRYRMACQYHPLGRRAVPRGTYRRPSRPSSSGGTFSSPPSE